MSQAAPAGGRNVRTEWSADLPQQVKTRYRVRALLPFLIGGLVAITGCSSAGRSAGGATPPTARPATTGRASAATTPATGGRTQPTSPDCTDGSVIAHWSVARRAAELVVVPVLDGAPADITVARQAGAGGILLLGSAPSTSVLRSELAPLHRTGAGDMLVMADEEGGGVQRLVPDVESIPWARTMASTMTTAQVTALARTLGQQMSALGVDTDLAPVLDVDGGPELSASDPDGPRSFSSDPTVAAAYGAAFEEGLTEAGELAVVKHFPGLGGASGNTDYGPADTKPITALTTGGLIPFQRVLAAGARAVMVANATVPGLTSGPASLSSAVITGLLRSQLHFTGLVMTDSLSAGAISGAGYSLDDAVVAAVKAGADMVLFGSTLTAADTAALAPGPLAATTNSIVGSLVNAVTTAALPESRLDQAVADVVAAERLDLCDG